MLTGVLLSLLCTGDGPQPPAKNLFARENLIAWCIVPFDAKKRGPEERAEVLQRLGFKHFAYDWRAEHIPTFDAEVAALAKRGVGLDAFWFPAALNDEAKKILAVIDRHKLHPELWVMLGDVSGQTQEARVETAARILKPVVDSAAKRGCKVGLYNHGGWFGEPENQIAVLKKLSAPNVGLVYNLHHGHDHLDRFPKLLEQMKPYLLALNLNGMVKNGDRQGRKILPLGCGDLELELLRTIRASGYSGPIGILGHTDDDAEERLADNLDGLDWLLPQLDGKPVGVRPKVRTKVPPPPPQLQLKPISTTSAAPKYDAGLVAKMLADARTQGDARRGAAVFADAKFACVNCHKVGPHGGIVGPELNTVATCLKPEEIVESLYWPQRLIHEGYNAVLVATADGRQRQAYLVRETPTELVLNDPQTGVQSRVSKKDVEGVRRIGSLMPEGLASAMTSQQQRDVLRFLLELRDPKAKDASAMIAQHSHKPAAFTYDSAPLDPSQWPNRNARVNRDRLYDFYAKEAEYFSKQEHPPLLLPEYPGLDGGKLGHWGNQNEEYWADGRWNSADLGVVLAGVFRGAGVTVPKGVCVRVGDRGELACCFNPQTLEYDAVWSGGFLKFSSVRHGFMDGLLMAGSPLPKPPARKEKAPFVYHGYYRHGSRVVFSYRLGEVETLDSPWVENGKFARIVGPAATHPLRPLTKGGPRVWPQEIVTKGSLGADKPYALDTITPPFDNPWKAPLFFGGNAFLPNGDALLCTMQGDVWRVSGIDATLQNVRWRRVASGLHQALGMVVADGDAFVVGRDQITRLRDLNGDGEYDFYECFSNAYETSTGGHDYICGLERDAAGAFYTACSKNGLLRISPDGRKVDVLATGFRNPDGLGLAPDGTITVPCSEGDWTMSSMVCQIRPGGFYGYRGPRNGKAPDLPFAYLPRGMDNSSGGQTYVDSKRWGPLDGQLLHFSFGSGTHFLMLREQIGDQPQGAVVPLPGDFDSGVHRGRFSPSDGQLYAVGMSGWGTYTPNDGCFQRVRYIGDPVQLPVAFHVHENGVLVTFSSQVDASIAGSAKSHFAQAWNYRYRSAYGSPEFSPKHRTPGHDVWLIAAAHVLADRRSVFLEIPDLQPVNQLHLHLRSGAGPACDMIATVHRLGPPFTGYPEYRPQTKQIAAHPMLVDLATMAKSAPNPWRKSVAKATRITIRTGSNLTFATPSFRVKAGEPVKLTLENPDVVPHNWVLVKPGALHKVGEQINRLIGDPDAVARQYVPETPDVIAYTDVTQPQEHSTIFFRAPKEKGAYPFLCSFPGHWMVMNGEMVVE